MMTDQGGDALSWGTFKSHGFETGEPFLFGGCRRKGSWSAPLRVYVERTSPTWLTFVNADTGAVYWGCGVATRFWARP